MTAPFRYFLVPNRVPLALAPRYYLTHFLTVNLEVHGLQGISRSGARSEWPSTWRGWPHLARVPNQRAVTAAAAIVAAAALVVCGGGLHINGIRNDTYDLHSYTSEVSGMVVGLSFNLMYYGPSSSTQCPWSDDGREDR